jgi:hypothetical protein
MVIEECFEDLDDRAFSNAQIADRMDTRWGNLMFLGRAGE